MLEIKNLTKKFGDKVAVDNIDLSVKSGAVSYTHLDVYKRQEGASCALCGSCEGRFSCAYFPWFGI